MWVPKPTCLECVGRLQPLQAGSSMQQPVPVWVSGRDTQPVAHISSTHCPFMGIYIYIYIKYIFLAHMVYACPYMGLYTCHAAPGPKGAEACRRHGKGQPQIWF
jgi:hypothetical protein